MEPKEKNQENLVKVSEKGLLSLVSDKLKDRVLFPNKIENAKNFISSIKNARLR